jgi:hypothetical protein
MSPIYVPGKVVLAKTYVEGDRNYSNVSLLLHGDGTNGSTTITDNSPTPKTVTAVGNAQISTAQSKFGGASIAFDGAGSPVDRVVLPFNDGTTTFGSANFTVEGWVYRNNTSDSLLLVGQGDLASVSTSSFVLYLGSIVSDFYIGGSVLTCASPSPSAATWAHVAWTRSGGTVRSFLNGSLVGSNASFGTLSINQGVGQSASLGSSFTGAAPFNGYIDDLRITKGVARYTATFTPPTAPFADAQY